MKNFNLIICFFFMSIIANAQLREIKNGVSIPPKGEFRAFIVFVDIDYSQSVCPCGFGSGDDYAPTWPVINGVTQVPTDAHTYFNPNLISFQSNPAFITDYFYQASFGSYKLFGDYYPKVIKVNCDEVDFGNGLNLILGKLQQEPLQNGTLYSASGLPLAAFDSWTPTAQGFQKLNTSDNKLDLLYIIWRNNKFLNGCGALDPSTGKYSGASDYSGFGVASSSGIAFADMGGVSAVTSFNTSGGAGYGITLMEHMHGTFGGDHWHSGGGAGRHTVLTAPYNYGLTAQSARPMYSASGWDRLMMDYKNPAKNFVISAKDFGNGGEVNTENFSIEDFPNGGTFALRDFMSTGDAIRIKLPHINWQANGDVKNQYLWLENHRMITRFDKYTEAECSDYGDFRYGTPGIYAYIQIGKDQKSGGNEIYNSTPFSEPNALGSFIMPVTAEGNYDFKYRRDLQQLPVNFCGNWNNPNIPTDKSQSLPNPFTGFSDLFQTLDYNNDGLLHSLAGSVRDNSVGLGLSEVVDDPYMCNNDAGVQTGNVCHNYNANGDWEDAFSLASGKSKLNISTNPAPIPVYTYLSAATYNGPNQNDPDTYENRKIHLNGLSIEILHDNWKAQGELIVQIRWDNFDVADDVRWCGDIVLNPNPFNTSNPSLHLLNSKTMLLDRGKSPTFYKFREVDAQTGDYIFTEPTKFSVESGAYFKMDNNSSVIVDNKSEFILKTGSIMEIGSEASFIVRNGSKFIVEEGAHIIVNYGGKILIEGNESEMHYANSTIELAYSNSVLEINKGKLFVDANTDFTFTGAGFMRFFCGVDNTVIGKTGSKFIINGTGKNDKKIEILEGSLKMILIPAHPNLSHGFPLTITNARVNLAEETKIVSNSILYLDNVLFTSTTGAKNNHHGLHASVDVTHHIHNSTFEYGRYGAYSVLTLNHVHSNFAETIKFTNCIFRNNDYGLVTVGQGAHIENTQFLNNSNTGWSAQGMTMPSEFKNSSILNSPTGINYIAGSTGNLFINYSNVTNTSSNGIVFLGNALLSVNCSNINSTNNSSSKGIYLGDGASINMSPSLSPPSGRSRVTGRISIQGAEEALISNPTERVKIIGAANELFLDQGQNNLSPQSSQGKAINGNFYFDACPTSPIIANFNRWNSSNTSPANGIDYHVRSPMCINTTIFITDNNPGSIVCTAIARPRQSFYKPHEMAEANQGGPNSIFKKFERGLNKLESKDYIDAINEFRDILFANIPQPTPLSKKVTELSYNYMHYAVGKAYSEGLINNTGSGTNQYMASLLAIEDIRINKAILDSDISAEYTAKMDKAKSLVLADKRTDALPIFYGNYIISDSSNFEELDSWICIINKEQDLIDGILELKDFAEALINCQEQTTVLNRINNSNDPQEIMRIFESKGRSKNSNEAKTSNNPAAFLEETTAIANIPVFKFYPNPTNGKFTIESKNIHNIKIFNLIGDLIYEYKPNTEQSLFEIDLSAHAKGVYIIKVNGENYIEVKKLVHQ